jgi:rare lipoprotein A
MSSLSFKLAAAGSLALLLASCSSSRAPQPVAPVVQPGGAISGPSEFNRPHKDGAPWWDVDVSRIPDATPMPHYGRVKASPYTVFGKQYYPIQDARRYQAIGPASWYGTKFHGQATANGETYDLYGMTAAHKTLPLPSYVRVTNLENGKSAILRVNDRGPFYSDPHEWWAQQGQPVPMVLAQPQQAAQVKTVAQPVVQPLEQYTPPPQQHAAAVVPVQIDAKKNDSVVASGLYLQVAAFANPDAAELLKAKLGEAVAAPVFISSVVRNQQILHRVRLGPLSSPGEAEQLQDSVRMANLGQPTLVRAD